MIENERLFAKGLVGVSGCLRMLTTSWILSCSTSQYHWSYLAKMSRPWLELAAIFLLSDGWGRADVFLLARLGHQIVNCSKTNAINHTTQSAEDRKERRIKTVGHSLLGLSASDFFKLSFFFYLIGKFYVWSSATTFDDFIIHKLWKGRSGYLVCGAHTKRQKSPLSRDEYFSHKPNIRYTYRYLSLPHRTFWKMLV